MKKWPQKKKRKPHLTAVWCGDSSTSIPTGIPYAKSPPLVLWPRHLPVPTNIQNIKNKKKGPHMKNRRSLSATALTVRTKIKKIIKNGHPHMHNRHSCIGRVSEWGREGGRQAENERETESARQKRERQRGREREREMEGGRNEERETGGEAGGQWERARKKEREREERVTGERERKRKRERERPVGDWWHSSSSWLSF